MIFHASSRGAGQNLAAHLLNDIDNDHVEVLSIENFASDNLRDAFKEAEALSRGLKGNCTKYLFSVSLSPPPHEKVDTAIFLDAIKTVEKEFGFSDVGKAVVMHSKEGRTHVHAVFSRIDTDEMKAIALPFFKARLMDISRQIYIENDWSMPRGFVNKAERNPTNFNLAEWEQAKRVGKDPRTIKRDLQNAWASSDSASSFISAMRDASYRVCRGDRRGYLALDRHGEVYSLPKWIGLKTRQVRDRLGDAQNLPTIKEAQAELAAETLPKLDGLKAELMATTQASLQTFKAKKSQLVAKQRDEISALSSKHEQRHKQELHRRNARFRKGIGGLWDKFVSGAHKRTAKINIDEAKKSASRDMHEKDALRQVHLSQRRQLNFQKRDIRETFTAQKRGLKQDFEMYRGMRPIPDKSRIRSPDNENYKPEPPTSPDR